MHCEAAGSQSRLPRIFKISPSGKSIYPDHVTDLKMFCMYSTLKMNEWSLVGAVRLCAGQFLTFLGKGKFCIKYLLIQIIYKAQVFDLGLDFITLFKGRTWQLKWDNCEFSTTSKYKFLHKFLTPFFINNKNLTRYHDINIMRNMHVIELFELDDLDLNPASSTYYLCDFDQEHLIIWNLSFLTAKAFIKCLLCAG